MSELDRIVLGGGLGGLAAARRLAGSPEPARGPPSSKTHPPGAGSPALSAARQECVVGEGLPGYNYAVYVVRRPREAARVAELLSIKIPRR